MTLPNYILPFANEEQALKAIQELPELILAIPNHLKTADFYNRAIIKEPRCTQFFPIEIWNKAHFISAFALGNISLEEVPEAHKDVKFYAQALLISPDKLSFIPSAFFGMENNIFNCGLATDTEWEKVCIKAIERNIENFGKVPNKFKKLEILTKSVEIKPSLIHQVDESKRSSEMLLVAYTDSCISFKDIPKAKIVNKTLQLAIERRDAGISDIRSCRQLKKCERVNLIKNWLEIRGSLGCLQGTELNQEVCDIAVKRDLREFNNIKQEKFKQPWMYAKAVAGRLLKDGDVPSTIKKQLAYSKSLIKASPSKYSSIEKAHKAKLAGLAVSLAPRNFKSIPNKKLTGALYGIAFANGVIYEMDIPEKMKNRSFYRARVHHGNRLINIPAEYKEESEGLCLALLHRSVGMIDLPQKYMNENFLIKAVNRRPEVLFLISTEYWTPSLILSVVKLAEYSYQIISRLFKYYIDEITQCFNKRFPSLNITSFFQQLAEVATLEYPPFITNLKPEHQTQDLCDEVFKRHPRFFAHFKDEFKSQKMCEDIIILDANYIKHIPPEKRSKAVCNYAFNADVNLIEFIPIESRTDEMIEQAIWKNPDKINALEPHEITLGIEAVMALKTSIESKVNRKEINISILPKEMKRWSKYLANEGIEEDNVKNYYEALLAYAQWELTGNSEELEAALPCEDVMLDYLLEDYNPEDHHGYWIKDIEIENAFGRNDFDELYINGIAIDSENVSHRFEYSTNQNDRWSLEWLDHRF